MESSPHIPVLLDQVLSYLDIAPTDIVMDGTVGFGGHASGILAGLSSQGRYIGIDQDPDAIRFCTDLFGKDNRVMLFHDSFSQFSRIFDKININSVDKVLLDLGMSSFQLDLSARGFSFQRDEVLDMRMNSILDQPSAAEILQTFSRDALIFIFRNYGEIYHCERFVDEIEQFRVGHSFRVVADLVFCIKKGFYFKNRRSLFIRTCSQVFQALRIAVNHELSVLTQFLDLIVPFLSDQGRIAVISFHSLEDRLVKQFGADQGLVLKPLHKGVIRASQQEIRANPRAKSAKLRAFQKVNLQ